MEAISLLQWLFDGLLGLTLLWLGWQTLSCRDPFKAIVLFVAFGLLMALSWVRLDAPDVALAEAAIGAGLTGALLMSALAKLGSAGKQKTATQNQYIPGLHWVPAISTLLVAAGLAYGVLLLPSYAPGLNAEISANLQNSGVSNPVTAVLLNFRGYDTLLELVVLFMALLGVWSFGDATLHQQTDSGIVMNTFTRLLIPILILVSAYLLWVGGHAPGGAFQAGSVLAAAGVLMLLAGWRLHPAVSALPLRLVVISGSAVFVTVAVFSLLVEGQLLEYPSSQAGRLILLIETLSTLSIGATLAALFLGTDPSNIKHDHKEH